MNRIKRWSETESDADPVLRAVMRHARSQEANNEAMSALVATLEARVNAAHVADAHAAEAPSEPHPRVEPRNSSIRMRPRRPRWMGSALKAGLAFAASGAAWAAWVGVTSRAEPPANEAAVVLSVAPSAPSPASKAGGRGQTAPKESDAPPSAPVEVAATPPAEARPSAEARSPEVPKPGSQDEASALQNARQALRREPEAALAELARHAARYPSSTLREEREALVIEALLRLGRGNEAKQRLDDFVTSYPRSPYRRRLQATLQSVP